MIAPQYVLARTDFGPDAPDALVEIPMLPPDQCANGVTMCELCIDEWYDYEVVAIIDSPMVMPEDCVEIGTKVEPARVNGSAGQTTNDSVSIGNGWREDWTPNEIAAHKVPVFTCVEGCPVRELDEQSGVSKSIRSKGRNGKDTPESTYGLQRAEDVERGHNDEGTASRYFPTFKADGLRACSLYGMLSVCDNVNSAETISPQTDQQHDSVLNPVLEKPLLNNEDRTASLPILVHTVNENSKNTKVTTESTAQKAVTMKCDEQSVRAVLCAANLCASCATAIAQSAVVSLPDRSKIQMCGLPFTDAYNERILCQNLAWFVESLGSQDTTLTMTESTKLFGYAAAAINTYITMASLQVTKKSGRKSLLSTAESIETCPPIIYNAKAPTKERPSVNGIKHTTVKPLKLVSWLVRLVTPPNGVCLDMFAGSGTTIQAALDGGFNAIGIEQEADYIPLIRQRLEGYDVTYGE